MLVINITCIGYSQSTPSVHLAIIEMDPMVTMNEANVTQSYNVTTEIWPFPATHNAYATSFANFIAANMNNVNENGEKHDPMVLDCRTSNGAAFNLRKRRDEEDEATTISDGNTMNEIDSKRLKTNENGETKPEAEGGITGKPAEKNAKTSEQPKQDYIHVRARRGQATDSHSLAERVRREKISERMKILQDLVPGCNRVIGKAQILDEIINYIQSLQNQVEFLSMKLEAVNTQVIPGMEAFPSKEFGQQAFDTSGMAFNSQATKNYDRGTTPEWLHKNNISN